MIYQYGVENEKILPWHVWNSAVTMIWEEILSMSQEKSVMCPECGPRPEFLCNIKSQNYSDLFLEYSNKNYLRIDIDSFKIKEIPQHLIDSIRISGILNST
jgi:hypothetical protein